jgi:hypothetical protein
MSQRHFNQSIGDKTKNIYFPLTTVECQRKIHLLGTGVNVKDVLFVKRLLTNKPVFALGESFLAWGL